MTNDRRLRLACFTTELSKTERENVCSVCNGDTAMTRSTKSHSHKKQSSGAVNCGTVGLLNYSF